MWVKSRAVRTSSRPITVLWDRVGSEAAYASRSWSGCNLLEQYTVLKAGHSPVYVLSGRPHESRESPRRCVHQADGGWAAKSRPISQQATHALYLQAVFLYDVLPALYFVIIAARLS